MRISDWSSDVCSSDLRWQRGPRDQPALRAWHRSRYADAPEGRRRELLEPRAKKWEPIFREQRCDNKELEQVTCVGFNAACSKAGRHSVQVEPKMVVSRDPKRSEEHTSELQSLMRISYAVFCLKKNKQKESCNQKYIRQ